MTQAFWVDFIYTFIPIFVAMDVAGLIPMYLSLTKGFSNQERQTVTMQALFTAFVISVLFIAVGQFIFRVLGISSADFEIAGGILLLVFAIAEMMVGERRRAEPGTQVGVVPLGTPLIVGPAVLTSLIILIALRGYLITLTALCANLVLVGITFRGSERLVKLIGEQGLRAFSKVIFLFLAAIAVSMIRRGLQTFL